MNFLTIVFFILLGVWISRWLSSSSSSSRGARPLGYDEIDVNLLSLAAHVIKADGNVSKEELSFARNAFIQNFGTLRAEKAFRNYKNPENRRSVKDTAYHIKYSLSYDSRLSVINFLFQIAVSDGPLSRAESELIRTIAEYFSIYPPHYYHVYNAYTSQGASSSFGESSSEARIRQWYNLLGLEPGASPEEIKKSYRVLAKKYHPDRLSDLSPEEKKAAQEKFIRIQEAYQCLKKELNFV